MILCINCSQQTKQRIEILMLKGQYMDYSELISVAISTLSTIHDEMGSGQSMILSDSMKLELTGRGPRSEGPRPGLAGRRGTVHQETKPDSSAQVPDIFRLDDVNVRPAYVAPPPDDMFALGEEVPIDRWLFGQYNKILPAKVSCRALLRLQTGTTKGVPIEEATAKIAEAAATLGEFLLSLDAAKQLHRWDEPAIGFPKTGPNTDKSRLRYANQFVAGLASTGQLSGLPVGLKLLNRADAAAKTIALTEAGFEFARLTNPILDGSRRDPLRKFSEEELAFLLAHISKNVPVEDAAYRILIQTIMGGANTPPVIDAAMVKLISNDRAEKLSKSYLSSQRSGAMSRMTDLGLLTRIPDGTRISYSVTAHGRDYLMRSPSASV
jgi:hypothetical protein